MPYLFTDLYTDPQIHTADGDEYGDGNLGVRGMALFFHSHSCSAICKGLGLAKFDLAPKERDEIRSSRPNSISQTILRGQELVCESPAESDRADHFGNFFRTRCISVDFTRSLSHTSSSSAFGAQFSDSHFSVASLQLQFVCLIISLPIRHQYQSFSYLDHVIKVLTL